MASDIYSALAASQTPQNLYFKRMLEEGTNSSPIQSPWQGVSRLAHALLAGMDLRGRRDEEGTQFDTLFPRGGAPASATPASAPAGSADAAMSPIVNALAPKTQRVYSQDEINPIDAQVATPKELSHGVPDFVPQQYRPTMGKAAIDQDLPSDLLARQTRQESGFNPNAVSSAGARGISQFMPGTANDMGINPGDPKQAIPAQAAYLRQNIDKFGGSVPLGLAAYNWGPGNVEKNGGDISKMPAETQGYVRNIAGPQMAQQNDPAALPPNATPTQGFAIPGQPQAPPQGQRQAPQIPPDVHARARAMWMAGDKQTAAALLQPYMAPKDQVRPMTAEERTQWRVPEGMSAGIETTTGKPTYSPAQTNVSVNSVADPIREGIGKTFNEGRNNALTASREIIPQLHDARTALDQGALTGQFSDIKLMMHKVGTAFGMTDEQASNTETFRATIGRQVLGMAKSLGANPSNADRDYIEKVQGGQIKLEESTLRRLMDITEKYARQSIKNHNADADQIMSVQPDAYKGVAPIMRVADPPQYQKPTAPAPAQPQLAAPAQGGPTVIDGYKIRPR